MGTCGEVPFEQRRQHFIEGLQRLFGADAGLTVHVDDYTIQGATQVEKVVYRGFEGGYGQRFIESVVASSCEDPIVAIGAGLDTGAYRRRDVLSDRAWYATRWVAEEFHPIGLDDGIYARAALEGRKTECLAVFRPIGARPFTTEDRVLMDLVTTEMPRLLRPPIHPLLAEAKLALAPREAQTLERLCRGESEKEVAAALAISSHTVHVYVKSIYRHFGVMSRSELLARFIADAPPPGSAKH